MRLDIHLHDHRLNAKVEAIMATLEEVLDLVTAESTKLDSVIVLIDGLEQQLADALAGVTLPPAVQAKVDALFAGATLNAAKIVDALDTTPPPAP